MTNPAADGEAAVNEQMTLVSIGGTIKVEVTIRQAKIAAIRVLDHSHESDSYFNKAKKVINRIIKAGTPNVDTISGATYSSNGIINAVKNALKRAERKTVMIPERRIRLPMKKMKMAETKKRKRSRQPVMETEPTWPKRTVSTSLKIPCSNTP